MMRLLVGVFALAVLVPVQDQRTVYVTASDRDGQLVLDLTPEDFVVKESGDTREIVRASLAADRMQVALIVDDNGTGFFRQSVAALVQRILPHADIAIIRVMIQPHTLVDFTADPAALDRRRSAGSGLSRRRPKAASCSRPSTRPSASSSGASPPGP